MIILRPVEDTKRSLWLTIKEHLAAALACSLLYFGDLSLDVKSLSGCVHQKTSLEINKSMLQKCHIL